MKNNTIVTATIPFQGFYNSLYSYEIDSEIERTCEYYREEYGLSDNESEQIANGYLEKNQNEFYYNVSKYYAEQFIYELESETGITIKANFESIQSPKEYNFTTDRLFIEMPQEQALLFIGYILNNHKKELEELIEQRFTSQSGFISFYKNTLEAWGEPTKWDYNQIGTCFEVFAYLEEGIFEHMNETISNELEETLGDKANDILNNAIRKKEIEIANEKKQLNLTF